MKKMFMYVNRGIALEQEVLKKLKSTRKTPVLSLRLEKYRSNRNV